MDTARHIQTRGFRRWHERELLLSHANLVLVVLSTVALVGAIEAAGAGHGQQRLLLAGCALAAAGVAVHALRRYLARIGRAEHLAQQAVCPGCGTYAKWQVDRADADDERPAGHLQVCCRHCGQRWRLDW